MMLIYADKTTIQALVVASGFITTGAGSQIILLIMLPQEKRVSVKILKQKYLKLDIKNIEISQQILTAS